MGKRKSCDVADVGMRRPQKNQVSHQQVDTTDHSVDTVDAGKDLQGKTAHKRKTNAARTRQEGSTEKTMVPEESGDTAPVKISRLLEDPEVGIATTSTQGDKESPVKKKRSILERLRLRKRSGKKPEQGES